MSAKPKKEQQADKVYNITGGVHAGRDVIQGDQTNYITTNVANIHSTAEFVSALQQAQAQIAALKQGTLTSAQKRNIEAAELKVSEAVEETKKPQPLGEHVKTALTEAKETMELLAGSLSAAVVLGTTLGTLAMIAVKIFGG